MTNKGKYILESLTHQSAGSETHLILGGCGFIGRHVALLLAALGHRVILADRNPLACEFPAYARSRISWTHFDMLTADWEALTAGVSCIHHYAWSTVPASANADPQADLTVNVGATLALLETLRRGGSPPRLIFSSSGGTVYGPLKYVPASEDHPIAPITAYGVGKASVEAYLGFYQAAYGLDLRVARLANPFGAGQDLARGQGAVSTFLHRALTHQPITIWGDGETVRDYIHVADAAAGLVKVALRRRTQRGAFTFNIASGQGVSLNDIVRELSTQLAVDIEVNHERGRAFDVPISVLDVNLAATELGWSPRLSFSEGVARTIDDFRAKASFSTLGGNESGHDRKDGSLRSQPLFESLGGAND